MVNHARISHHYRMVGDINIDKCVGRYHYIISYVDIAHYCCICTNTNSISYHRCTLPFSNGIPANRDTMRNINLVTELYTSVYDNSSVMPDNKPFSKIGIIFYMNTCLALNSGQFMLRRYYSCFLEICDKSLQIPIRAAF